MVSAYTYNSQFFPLLAISFHPKYTHNNFLINHISFRISRIAVFFLIFPGPLWKLMEMEGKKSLEKYIEKPLKCPRRVHSPLFH
jgi:hypothetical protein